MRMKLWIPIGIVCVAAAAMFILAPDFPLHVGPRSYTVELGNRGFYPPGLRIQSGDTVRFVNTTDAPSWPASDPHPVHEFLPTFDPGEPIEPHAEWHFTFEDDGVFTYHDHLAPLRRGTIVVGNSDFSRALDTATCDMLVAAMQQSACWQFVLKNTLEEKGLDAGIVVFRKLIEGVGDCHFAAHLLGEAAFDAYQKGSDIQIGNEGTFCGYGFWHGFVTKLTTETGLASAEEFCATMQTEEATQLEYTRDSCFHGIGIGLVPDPPPLALWGRAEPLIEPVLAYCSKFKEHAPYGNTCRSGAFHAIVNYTSANQYGFSINENDPLALCRSYDGEVQDQCVYQFSSQLYSTSHGDIARVYTFLENIPDPKTRARAFRLASMGFVHPDMPTESLTAFLSACTYIHSVADQCVPAIVQSVFDKSEPGAEYSKALSFCAQSQLSSKDRASCYRETAKRAEYVYDAPTRALMCRFFPEEYQHLCQGA